LLSHNRAQPKYSNVLNEKEILGVACSSLADHALLYFSTHIPKSVDTGAQAWRHYAAILVFDVVGSELLIAILDDKMMWLVSILKPRQ
jgi:hypothetical protein